MNLNNQIRNLLDEMAYAVSVMYDIQSDLKEEVSKYYEDEDEFLDIISRNSDYSTLLDTIGFCFSNYQ